MSSLPLDKKEIIIDSCTRRPALHSDWVTWRGFVAYQAPPADSSDHGLMGEWLKRLQYICTDLHWLLQLPHQLFWCQIIFDESLHSTLDSFLRYAPRPYDTGLELTGEGGKLQGQVTRLVFFTYLRMATYKESQDHWLSPKVFGDILYENFLFDIPKLMDLCALYGHSNGPLLSKMVTNVFTQQPHYLDDLRATVPTILQVFANIAVECGLELDSESEGLTPQTLELPRPHQTSNPPASIAMETQRLLDIVLYLADTALTLTSFLDLYRPACAVLHKLNFCSHLAHMYEKLIPALQSAVKQGQFDSVKEKKLVRNKLRQARLHLLTTFHLIVSHTCLQPVLDSISTEEDSSTRGRDMGEHLESFLSIMAGVLGEKRFLADYEGQFSFQDDIDILSQAVDVDETHWRYISDAINAAFAAHGERKKPKGNTNRGGRTSPDGSPCPASAQSSSARSVIPASGSASIAQATPVDGRASSVECSRGAEAGRVTGVELDSLICSVKDLFPDLGNGFIQLALEELGYNAEKVINAVLEDNLPAAVQNVPFDLDSVGGPAALEEEEEEALRQSLLVENRRNIYDNDEFDVFNNPSVDVHRIHKGKKEVEDTVLEDKESVRELRSLYEAYGSMDVSSMYDPQMYDDEYDDTYDVNNVGAKDADSADELTQRRPFTVPQVLQKRAPKPVWPDSSPEEEDQGRDQFVQDPAKLREQQEQKRAVKDRRPPPAREVKGKAKGQGQTDEVLRNRRFKEMNKGSRSNHNRRAMSDKKHSKGMF